LVGCAWLEHATYGLRVLLNDFSRVFQNNLEQINSI
jgi:succinate dehydrogenase/fumarate reductase cytochrome b subunit